MKYRTWDGAARSVLVCAALLAGALGVAGEVGDPRTPLSNLVLADACAGEQISIHPPARRCRGVQATGVDKCYSQAGLIVACAGTGQDAEFRYGLSVDPYPRFTDNFDGTVTDNLTGLIWLQDAGCFFPYMIPGWQAALDTAATLEDGLCGLEDGSEPGDWRVPDIRQLQSLMDYGRSNPALPAGHPFVNLYWPWNFTRPYWSSTTVVDEPQEAWFLFSISGRVFAGDKLDPWQGDPTLWAVRVDFEGYPDSDAAVGCPEPAGSATPPAGRGCRGVQGTGQTQCYSQSGETIPCAGTGQDGRYRTGFHLEPPLRFTDNGDGTVTDNLTALIWLKKTSCLNTATWEDALAQSNELADGMCDLTDGSLPGDWRLPNLREMHSMIDYSQGSFPAIPPGHPFQGVLHRYWTSSTPLTPSTDALLVHTTDGRISHSIKGASEKFWPVRGGE